MTTRAIVTSMMGGLVGGLLGAGVMSVAYALVTRIAEPPRDEAKQGGDDATVKVGNALSQAVRGRRLAEGAKSAAGAAVHYAFGAVMGALYGAVAAVVPRASAGAGLVFGAAAWLGPHAIVVPALGLAPSPLAAPPAKEGLELALHLLYGATVELARRAVVRIAR
ncbi:MAG TPA: DUF1440 domain-containing protein [Methylomirabilota bacterium]|jgi:uncharacterized membrane protein YagU involved in acid resistance